MLVYHRLGISIYGLMFLHLLMML